MTGLIKLRSCYERDITINPDNIAFMIRERDMLGEYTRIDFSGGEDKYCHVRETPEEIIKKVEETQFPFFKVTSKFRTEEENNDRNIEKI